MSTFKKEIAEHHVNIVGTLSASKFGKGKSVAKLRKKGIGKSEIDNFVEKYKIVTKARIG